MVQGYPPAYIQGGLPPTGIPMQMGMAPGYKYSVPNQGYPTQGYPPSFQ